MQPSLILFISALSFLAGVACASFGLPLPFALAPAGAIFAGLFAGKADARIALAAAGLFLAGFGYFSWDDARYRAALSLVPAHASVHGMVVEDPHHTVAGQLLAVATPLGKLTVLTDDSPAYAYGDTLSLEGAIAPPSSAFDINGHIVGVMKSPGITRLSSGGGDRFLSFLYMLKHEAEASFTRVLSPSEAGLLSGIVFGDSGRVPKALADDLSQSGTRFITAIDGLHMQIAILILFGALVYLFPKRMALALTSLFVACFIALTGFSASGIRAGLMAAVAGAAKGTGRIYVPHNALALAGLVLTLANPKTLLFDAGFQLSFVAVLGILYVMPVLTQLAHLPSAPGILGWRQSLLITVSVQLAAAPIVISQFGTFSLTSFVAAVSVAWLVPFTMGAGFLLALLSLAPPAALAFSFLVAPMLEYVMLVVHFFAALAVPFNPPLGFPGITLYYATLVSFLLWWYEAGARKRAAARPSAA